MAMGLVTHTFASDSTTISLLKIHILLTGRVEETFGFDNARL